MKRKILLVTFLLIMLVATNVFAATPITMEIVENNVCTISLGDEATFEKKIISSDLDNYQVTLQLQISNNAVDSIPTGELILVIDSSSSMNTSVTDTETRKDLVLNSANSLVESLLALNSSTLDIAVVTFSSSTVASEMGTEADAQLVSDFTNDLDDLQTSISAIEGTGQYTDLDAGLKLAGSTFTSDDGNKYLIILTDGVPNMNVGNSDLITYDALTEVITTTKEDLTSLDAAGVSIISMLTGIENEDATVRQESGNYYTYAEVITGIFGTEDNPTAGKFYNISDDDIETTITEEIYADLVPTSKTLTNITVVDYFPQDIVDNFEMDYVDGIDVTNVSSSIDTETNSITWTISELGAGETATIQYTLTLKDDYDEEIIGEILDTNEKVDITYNDFDGNAQETSSDVTPKIRLTDATSTGLEVTKTLESVTRGNTVITSITSDFKAKVGDVLNYKITVKNSGNVVLTNVVVSDTIETAGGTKTLTVYSDEDCTTELETLDTLEAGSEIYGYSQYTVTDADAEEEFTLINTAYAKSDEVKEVPSEPVETNTVADETVADEPLPSTGTPIVIGILACVGILTAVFAVKSKKFDF